MKCRNVAAGAIAVAFLHISTASAAQIKYVFDGTASGTVGGTSFSDVDLSVTAVGNPADVPAPDSVGVIRFNTPVTIDIGGVGSTVIATGAQIGAFPSEQFVYFGVGPSDIQVFDSSIATYLFKTSIGPIFDATDPSTVDWVNMSTPLGDLTVSSYTSLTFTATLNNSGGGSAVPLPKAAWLSLSALPLVAFVAARQRRVRV